MKRIVWVTFIITALLFAICTMTASAATYGDLEYEVYDGEVTITDCNESVKSMIIPKTIDGYPVTIIGWFAFEGCTSLTSITIPDSVTIIGDETFRDCTSLTSITIPDSVTSIGGYAFKDCTSLTSITIPDSVTSVDWYAFGGCTSLTSVTIGNSVTSIGDYAFRSCTSLTSITIPDSVTSIGSYAFDGTAYYNNISNWENGVLYIGNHLIKAKDTLSGSYSIREGTKSIAEGAFSKCTSLTSITIPDSVTSIGGYAFYACTNLTSITIPDSVTSIGNHAFEYCTSLTSITIPDGVISIGTYAFLDCTNLTSITIPDSVTSIGDYAFYDCTSLKDVFYSGTAEEWKRISIVSYGYEPLTKATIHYNYVPSEPILSTDIRSFIFGSEISSYNINGNTGIVAEDLTGYGFTVIWDGNARTLSITHPSDDYTQAVKRNFGPKTGKIGERLTSTLSTDIKTYINGKMVKSFNIGGQTVIYIDDLAVFGAVTWDGTARTISVE